MAAFAFLSRSLQQISTFVITILAARFLAPAEYGIYALGVVFVALIQTLTYTGVYQFVINAKAEDHRVLSVTFWLITGLATAAALALAAAAVPIAMLYDAPDLATVLVLLAVIQPIAGYGAWASATLLRRGLVQRHFVIMFVQNAVALVGGVILLWTWQSLFALVAFRYLRVLTGGALYAVLTPDRPSLAFDRALAREATGFSGGLYAARFLNFLSRYAADLLLGIVYTTAEAGLYRFGNRLAGGGIDVIQQPMRSFALTQFGAAGRADGDFAPILRRFVGTVTLMSGGTAAALVVFAEDLVALLFDPAYLAGLGVMYAMALRAVFAGASQVEPVFAALQRTQVVMWFNLVWAVVTVATVLATVRLGLVPLAWSQAAVTTAMALSALGIIGRLGGVRVRGALTVLAGALALAAVYGGVLWATWPPVAEAVAGALGAADPLVRLGVGLAWALALSVPVLWVAGRTGIFTLRVFSG